MQTAEAEKKESGIKILGGGCAKCNALEAATVDALRELGMDTTIDHVRDFEKIAAYGVMTTPALVVDGQVVSYGKVLKKDEVIAILKKVRKRDILNQLEENSTMTQIGLMEVLGLTRKQIQKAIKELQEEGLLVREGSNRNGRWVVKK